MIVPAPATPVQRWLQGVGIPTARRTLDRSRVLWRYDTKDCAMNILAISGSLRPTSTISTFLRATIGLAPAAMAFTTWNGLGDLPHFTPDLTDEPIATVSDLREQLLAADGVLICTPEYAYSMPGSLKNAFEWTVSSGEFVGKPVAAISASPYQTGGERALASLVL